MTTSEVWKRLSLELITHIDINDIINDIPSQIRVDREFILAALKRSIDYINHVDPMFWKDKEIMLQVIEEKPEYFELITEDKTMNPLKWDIDINVSAIKLAKNMFLVHPKMWKNEDFAKIIIPTDPHNFFPRFSKSIKEDKKMITLAMEAGAGEKILALTTSRIREDREFIKELLTINPRTFQYASQEIKQDQEMVMLAIHMDPNNIYWVDPLWRKDVEVFRIITQHKEKGLSAMKNVHDSILDDKSLMIEAVSAEGLFLRYASARLRRDVEVIAVAIHQNGLAIRYVPKSIREPTMVLMAIRSNWRAIEAIHEPSTEEILMALESDWRAIEFASSKQKNDPEVACKAIKKSIDAIEYVFSPDKRFFLTAVQALSKRVLQETNDILLEKDTEGRNQDMSTYRAILLLRKYHSFIAQNTSKRQREEDSESQSETEPKPKRQKEED